MSSRIVDGLLLLVVGLFLFQAFHTPEEAYDVMGPALWPGFVAVFAIALLVLMQFGKRPDAEGEAPMRARFWLFCSAAVVLVAIQSLGVAPFFLAAALYCFCSYLLIAYQPDALRLSASALGSLVFCYVVQWLFTNLVYLDLPVTF